MGDRTDTRNHTRGSSHRIPARQRSARREREASAERDDDDEEESRAKWRHSRIASHRLVVRSTLERAVIVCVACVGFLSSSSAVPARVHRTISFDEQRQAEDAELDSEMSSRGAELGEGDAAAAAAGSVAEGQDKLLGEAGASREEEAEMAAYDAEEEDLQSTLAHMKQEHAQHLEQFNEAAAAAGGVQLSPAEAGSPLPPQPQHRRIFIVARNLSVLLFAHHHHHRMCASQRVFCRLTSCAHPCLPVCGVCACCQCSGLVTSLISQACPLLRRLRPARL